MALWGKVDGAQITATTVHVLSNNTIEGYSTLRGVGTAFTSEIEPGNVLVLDADLNLGTFGAGPEEVYVVRVDDDENVTVKTALVNGRENLGIADGTDVGRVDYRETPKYVPKTNIQVPSQDQLFGADNTETANSGKISHAGWVIRHAKERDGITHYWYETLVASSSITGDTSHPGDAAVELP